MLKKKIPAALQEEGEGGVESLQQSVVPGSKKIFERP
jgi:hypothetical protein